MSVRSIRRRIERARERYAEWKAARAPRELALEQVRRRLELLLAALHGRDVHVEALAEPARRGTFSRLAAMRVPRHLRGRDRVPQSDESTVRLPARLVVGTGWGQGGDGVGSDQGQIRDRVGSDPASDPAVAAALARYRLLALVHAERVVRGSSRFAPGDDRPLERDLYLLRESLHADAAAAGRMRVVAEGLREERAAALRARPPLDSLDPLEQRVEHLMRAALANPLDAPDAHADGPHDSLRWAEATAAELRAGSKPRARYRGIAPVVHWGTVRPSPMPLVDADLPTSPVAGGEAGAGSDLAPKDDIVDPRRAIEARPEMSMQHVAAMTDAQGDADRARLRADGAATDVASELGRNLVRADGGERGETADAEPSDGEPHGAGVGEAFDPRWRDRAVATVRYAEWDHRAQRHVARAATVRVVRPPDAEGEWAARVLHEHAALVRQIRHRFERLRARRTLLGGQREGEELDISACVRALVERRAGVQESDDLYVAVRAARRPIAILLLADVSGSTDAPITGKLRIVDVERIALLLTGEALEAMGDPYAMMAFSGRGAGDVRVATLKDFGERYGEAVRRRVSALEPRGNTRLGAAIRHATATLARQPVAHRLLLLLSDGQPNDSDHYVGDYGVEDSRQAVHEARARGVFPFCLTVDREAPEYLPRIFGAAGHTVLRNPAQLPEALLEVVKGLVAS